MKSSRHHQRGRSGIMPKFKLKKWRGLCCIRKHVHARQRHWDFVVNTTPTQDELDESSEVDEGTVTFERAGSGIAAKFKWTKRKEMFVLINEDVHEPLPTSPEAGVSIGQAGAILEALGALHIGGAGALNVANDTEEADIQVRLKNAHIQMAEGAVIEVQPSVTDIANRSKNAGVSLDRGPIIVKMEENSKLKISGNTSVGNDVDENSKVNLKSEGLDITLKQQANVEISQTLNIANAATSANVDIEIGHQTLECEEGATAKLAGGMDGFTVAMEQLQPTLRNEGYLSKDDEIQRLKKEKASLSLNMMELKTTNAGIMRQVEEMNQREATLIQQLEEERDQLLEEQKRNLETKLIELEKTSSGLTRQLEEERHKREETLKIARLLEEERDQLLEEQKRNLETKLTNIGLARQLEEERHKREEILKMLEEKMDQLLEEQKRNLDTKLMELEKTNSGLTQQLEEERDKRAEDLKIMRELEEEREKAISLLKVMRQLEEENEGRFNAEKTNLELRMKELETKNSRITRQLEEERDQREVTLKTLTVKHTEEMWEERKKVSQFSSILQKKVNLIADVLHQANDERLPQLLPRLIRDFNIRDIGQDCGLNLQVEMPTSSLQEVDQQLNEVDSERVGQEI